MAIPDFQRLMLPLLQHFGDGKEHANQETLDALAGLLQLTTAERAQLLPSGKQALFTNRLAWAKSHLKQAGLIASPRRGVYGITARGAEVLRHPPDIINMRFLDQFPAYRTFRTRTKAEVQVGENPPSTTLTPQEYIESGYQQLRITLATELLTRVQECSPDFFERLVVELLLAMGYGGSRQEAGQAVGKSGDGGIDGIIKEDRLGLDVIYIQAKRWEGAVGRPEVQKFAGALQGQRARKGIFLTTSSFTKEAVAFAAAIDSKIVLIGGEELVTLMIDHNIGVTPVASYDIKRVDTDYFAEE
jgi:restriction system protein